MNIDKPNNEEDTETQSDFDMDAATAEISSELFGQGGDEESSGEEAVGAAIAPTEGEEEKSSDGPDAVDAADPPPQSEEKAGEEKPAAEENAVEVQALGAPQTWTKEALTEWAAIPPRAQQEILKREEDFFKGIEQYKGAAEVGQRYSSVVEPYAPILAAENIDPVQMFQSFAANHYILTRGTPEQKIELAAAMLDGYEIPLPQLFDFLADRDTSPVDPTVIALQNELKEIKTQLSTRQTTEQNQAREVINREIETFAADPAHPYFNELADDISKLFASGLATSLPEAYEKALFANPVTRQKELARLTAEKQATVDAEAKKRKDKVAKSTADSVDVKSTPRDGTVPIGSIDDTLNETMAAIQSRG